MTLKEHLGAGYRHQMRGGSDPAPACAAEIPHMTLEAEAARLEGVKDRCHISRTRLKFLRRVLSLDVTASKPA